MNDTERWRRIKSIFDEAVDAPSADRSGLVRRRCGSDSQLAEEVRSLLSLNDTPSLALDQSAVNAPILRMLEQARHAAGEILAERYRILRFIASGGMGEVYEAFDLVDEHSVALKFIGGSGGFHRDVERRLLREVELVQRIDHPNVCRIRTLEQHGEERFCVMDMLVGETLAARLSREHRLTSEDALPVVTQICDGLEAAHRAGVLHRDLKPGNIFMVGPRAVIIDFGLAAGLAELGSLTPDGAVIGTLAYMAPEQMEQDSVTPAADLYSLGVIMYEMLTGAKPHRAKSPFRLAAEKARESHRPPREAVRGVPAVWEEAIARCLHVRPEHRFASAVELAALLERGRPTVGFVARRWSRRLRAPAAATVAIAAALLIWSSWTTGHRPAPSVAALYEEAQWALNKASPVRAQQLLERAVKADPDFIAARAALAVSFAALDQPDSARDEVLRTERAAKSRWFLGRDESEALAAARDEVVRDFREAADHYRKLADRARGRERTFALLALARMLERSGQNAAALPVLEAVVREDPQNSAGRVRLGLLLCRRNQYDRAAAEFRQAEKDYEQANNGEGLSEAILARVSALPSGSAAEDRRALNRVLQLSYESGNRDHNLTAQFRLGIVAVREKDYERGVELTRAAAAQARREGLPGLAARALGEFGYALVFQRKQAEAVPVLREAVELAERTNSYGVLAANSLRLGEALYGVGQFAEAISVTEPAVLWYREAGYDDVLPLALIKFGTVLSGTRTADAQRAFREAVDLATRSGNEMYRNMALQRFAAVLDLVDLRAATAAWEQALPEMRKNHATSQYFPAATAFGLSGNSRRAEEIVAEGEREIFAYHTGIDRDAFFDRAHAIRAALALYRGDCDAARTEARLVRTPIGVSRAILGARVLMCAKSVAQHAIREAARELEQQLDRHAAQPVTTLRISITLAALELHRRDWSRAAQYAERGIAATGEAPVLKLEAVLVLRAAKFALGDREATDRLTANALDLSRQIGLEPPANLGGRADLLRLWRMVPAKI
jgi:serine/threonine protein kinase